MVYARDGTTPFSDVSVTLRNNTKHSWSSAITESDGSFAFDLSNFVGGYSNGDSLNIEAELGSFYQSTTGTVNTSQAGLDFSLTLEVETPLKIINKFRLMNELNIFFRKNLADPENRGNVETTVQSGTGSKVKFSLPRRINCVHSVLVNGAVLSDFTDYYVDYKDETPDANAVVYFLSPPSNNAEVEFKYHYGTTWIYPDVPRVDLKLWSYPRVSIRMINFRTAEGGLGTASNITDVLGTMDVYSPKESELDNLIQTVRALIMKNKSNFHYFKLIIPQGTGPMLISPSREERILQQSQDFIIQWRLEVNN